MRFEPSSPIRVLGRASSINVRKVLWTCDELGVGVVHEPWGEGERSLRSAEFLALNPHGLVPVLVHGDAPPLRESNTLCRYLAACQPQSTLLPQEPAARARVEQWMDWQIAELNVAWRDAFMALVRHAPRTASQVDASIAAWNRHMALLDDALKVADAAWICGDTFTLADIVLGLSTHRWLSTPFPKPALPALQRYRARLGERAGFRRWGDNGQP